MAPPSVPPNWSQNPRPEFANADRRVPNNTASSSDRQGGPGFTSIFVQRPQYNTALAPPEFSRPIPFRAPGALQWFSPVVVRSRSPLLTEGFPLDFPAQELPSHDVYSADWANFLSHIDSVLRSGAVADPAGHGHAAQVLVAQWNSAFFAPRRIRVTLRPEQLVVYRGVDVDRSDARSISSVSSSSSSSSFSSSSSDERDKKKYNKRLNRQRHDYPDSSSGSWAVASPYSGMAPPMAGPSTGYYPRDHAVDRKIRKAERRSLHDQHKVEKAQQKAERKVYKREMKIAQKEQKAMRKGNFALPQLSLAAPMSARGSGYWEIIVDCL